jgi:hypothetical protein
MELFFNTLEPSFLKKDGNNLVYPSLFNYENQIFILNPSLRSPANDQITSKTQLDSEKTEFSGDLTVLASSFQDSVWTNNGWDLDDIENDIQYFYDSNLVHEESNNTSDNPGMNCFIVRKNIDEVDYTIIFFYVGNQSNILEVFNYSNFATTDGLNLVSTSSITNDFIYLTNTSGNDVGNVWRNESINYDRSFELYLNFECSGGTGADGFCVQWYTLNNVTGGTGGAAGLVSNSEVRNAVQFLTWAGAGGNRVRWAESNIEKVIEYASLSFRQNIYYWLNYDHSSQIMSVYYSTSNTKPSSANHTFNSFSFDSTAYFFGVGAATGGSTDNHILKAMSLIFV